MTTYVLRDGELIEKALAGPLYDGREAPGVIRDGMDATWHPANGQRYDSKRAFREATKRAGCIEVGDQSNYGGRKFAPQIDRRQVARDIKRSIEQLRGNGR